MNAWGPAARGRCHAAAWFAVGALVVLAGCGPSRPQADRVAPTTTEPVVVPVDPLCDVLVDALPILRKERLSIVDLVQARTQRAVGDAAIIAFGRLMSDGHFGRFDPALRYLVDLSDGDLGPTSGRAPPTKAVIESARSIDREIARGRCR